MKDSKAAPDSHWLDEDYFTLRAISDSFKVIWVNLLGKARHLYEEHGNYRDEPAYKGIIQITQKGYEDFELDPKRMEYLKEIKKICDERGIRIIAFTTPYAFNHVQLINSQEYTRNAFVIYKQAMAEAFGFVHDFANPANEPFATDEYYSDSTHANRKLSHNMIKVMFDQANDLPKEFGKKITP